VGRLQRLVEQQDRLRSPEQRHQVDERAGALGSDRGDAVRPQQEAGQRREDDDVGERPGDPRRQRERHRRGPQQYPGEQQHDRRDDARGEQHVVV
jgi:hypothetical protein